MRQSRIGLLLVSAVLLSGCGAWNELFGSSQAAETLPSNCSRAPLEVIITRAGTACSATNPCPSGSYCNTGGVCAWACYSDGECAAGQACGCDGRCTGTAPSPDGGAPTTVDLSCNKDSDLLFKIVPSSSNPPLPGAALRPCDNDQRCPAGSYCDPATGNCNWDCHPMAPCPSPTQTCDCSGHCVAPNVAPAPGDKTCRLRQKLDMAVSPRTSALEGNPASPANWTRTVTLTLSSPSPVPLTGTPPSTTFLVTGAQVYIVPRANTQVNCAGTWTSSRCTLTRAQAAAVGTTGWRVETFNHLPDPPLSRATIQIQVRANPGVVASQWHVDAYCPGAEDSPQGWDFRFDPDAAGITATQPAPVWTTPASLVDNVGYRGTLVVRGAADVANPAVSPLALPVVAKTLANQVIIYDATRTLTSSGAISVPINGAGGTTFYLNLINDPRLFVQTHGRTSGGITRDPATGALRGMLTIAGASIPSMINASFTLTQLPAGQPLPTIPSEPLTGMFEADYGVNEFWMNGYFNATSNLLAQAIQNSSNWLVNPYSYDRGLSSPVHVSKPAMIGTADNLVLNVTSPRAGFNLCEVNFLGEYIGGLNRTWTFQNRTYQSTVTALPRIVDLQDVCASAYTTQDQLDNWAPCLDGVHNEANLRAQASFTLTASCAEFRNNQAYSGFPVTKDYASWLAQDCRRVGGPPTTTNVLINKWDITTGTPVAAGNWDVPLYICPQFKRSYVRIPNATSSAAAIASDASAAEVAYCYDPQRSGSAVLWSGRLADGAVADNTLEFSGDLLCKDEYNNGYVPRMFPLLTHADRSLRGEVSPQDGESASLLDACLAELRAPAGTFGQNDGTQGGVFGAIWNSFSTGNARCINMPRFQIAMSAFHSFTANPSLRDRKLLSHILKQWIEVHSFISYQGLEESRLRRVLASATTPSTAPVTTFIPDPSTLSPIHLEDLLGLVNQSWEQVLSMYFGTMTSASLQQFLVDALPAPDYRDWSGSLGVYSTYPERKPQHDQWLGLPVVMMEGLNQELRLLRVYLEEAALRAYQPDQSLPNPARDEVLARYSDTIRLVYLIEGVAANLFTRSPPAAAWLDRWATARDELVGLREDVRRAALALSHGNNPLGIEEDDLPIFFGDPQGTNSRYFASSDYLVDQWAVPAVSAAEGSLATARDAWLQARNARIQERMTQADRDRRVEELKSREGQRIIDNCGLVGIDSEDVLDAMQPGASGTRIQPETCFIAPSCLARASLSNTDLAGKVSQAQVQFRLCMLNETSGYRILQPPMANCAAAGSLGTTCTVADLFSDFNSAFVTADANRRADLVCQAKLRFRAPLPSARDMIGALDPSCYRGRLGAAALQIIGAGQDIDIARKNWDTAQQSFELDRAYCQQTEAAEMDASTRASLLSQTLTDLAAAKLQADWSLNAADSFFGWAGAAAGFITNPGAVVGGIGSLVEGTYKQQSLLAADAMDRAQREYDTAMRIKQANDAIRGCWHNVDKSQLAIGSAYALIARRGTDLLTAGLQLTTLMNENLQAIRQGANSAKREKDRFVPTVAHHYWLDEKIDRFGKDFGWAKRMTYLAMRAVEYEFQQSLPLRTDVLSASHPDQLRDALATLRQEVGTRTINRRRPEESSIVLSLRDDALALVDHSADAAGERRTTPTRGLQGRLSDPRFAVHDADGNWLGQGIPFNLGPEGALNYRCGERLWRVTATVQGDGLSQDEPGVSLLVLKRNTFASQWCEDKGDGKRFQYGSVQPSRRLFGENGGEMLESEANGFSTALVYPWFNVRRADFFKIAYRDGASEELAGRGLYGDYILLFPRQVLEGTAGVTDACVSIKRTFPLDQVEDVLLRFDYLSVDNVPAIQE